MENFNKNQQKSLEYHTFFFNTIKLMFTDMNIYSINNKTDHISEKYIFWYFPDFRSDLEQDPDPDLLFHETDPRIRIRIHIKMKRIRNTVRDTWNSSCIPVGSRVRDSWNSSCIPVGSRVRDSWNSSCIPGGSRVRDSWNSSCIPGGSRVKMQLKYFLYTWWI